MHLLSLHGFGKFTQQMLPFTGLQISSEERFDYRRFRNGQCILSLTVKHTFALVLSEGNLVHVVCCKPKQSRTSPSVKCLVPAP